MTDPTADPAQVRHSDELGIAILAALGIDPVATPVRRLVIDLTVGDIAIVEVTHYVKVTAAGITQMCDAIAEYHLTHP